MAKERLEQLLDDLRQQIEQLDSLDERARAELEGLQNVIARRLRREAGADEDDRNLVEPVREAIDEFEDAHPTLTMTLGRIMDVLNKLGI